MGVSGYEGSCDIEIDEQTGYHDRDDNAVYVQAECITYEKRTGLPTVSNSKWKQILIVNLKKFVCKCGHFVVLIVFTFALSGIIIEAKNVKNSSMIQVRWPIGEEVRFNKSGI